MSQLPRSRRSRGYSLSFLFLLVAACAVVAAVGGKGFLFLLDATVVVVNARNGGNLINTTGGLMDEAVRLAIAFATVFVALLLGAIIGLYHYRKLRGLGWGSVAGLAVGLLAAPLAVVPQSSLSHLVTATLGGSCILLAVAVANRFMSRPEIAALDGEHSE